MLSLPRPWRGFGLRSPRRSAPSRPPICADAASSRASSPPSSPFQLSSRQSGITSPARIRFNLPPAALSKKMSGAEAPPGPRRRAASLSSITVLQSRKERHEKEDTAVASPPRDPRGGPPDHPPPGPPEPPPRPPP